MSYRILLVGGGTGGHVFPLKAVCRELQKAAQEKGVNLDLLVMVDSERWRAEFENSGVKFQKILAPKLRRVEGGRLDFFAFFAIPFALIQAFWNLFIFMPDLVFSKGGFVSFIPSLVAKIYFISLFIHETDIIPGKTNRILSKFSRKTFVSFQSTASHFKNKEVVVSGNPIRESLFGGDKAEAVKYFNLNPDKKTILFLTGVQGVGFINRLVISSIIELTREFQIIHQTGVGSFNLVKDEAEKIKSEGKENYSKNIENNYRVYGFLTEEELKNAYAICDLVVARAGSNIFEIAAAGKPAIIIPYPYAAGNHQMANAIEFAKFGAVVLEEQNLSPNIFIDQVRHLINNPSVGEKIKQFAKMGAAKVIAGEIVQSLTG